MKFKIAKKSSEYLGLITAVTAIILAANAWGFMNFTLTFAWLYGIVLVWIGGFLISEALFEGKFNTSLDVASLMTGLVSAILGLGQIITMSPLTEITGALAGITGFLLIIAAAVTGFEVFKD